MAIFTWPMGTWPNPTLLGWVLLDLWNVRAGLGFNKPTRSGFRSGASIMQTCPEPKPDLYILKLLSIYIYIYIYIYISLTNYSQTLISHSHFSVSPSRLLPSISHSHQGTNTTHPHGLTLTFSTHYLPPPTSPLFSLCRRHLPLYLTGSFSTFFIFWFRFHIWWFWTQITSFDKSLENIFTWIALNFWWLHALILLNF